MIRSLTFLLMTAISATAAENLFYITSAGNKEGAPAAIYTSTLDVATGKISPVETAIEVQNPYTVAISKDGKTLYCAHIGAATIGAYRVDGKKLTLLNEKPSEGGAPCHLFVDATGRNLFVSNYSGASLISLRLNEDGSLGERTAQFSFPAPTDDPTGKNKAHGHGTYADPENRFVYACDLGSDFLWRFAFDAEKGTLTPVDSNEAVVPNQHGPRHLALHPNGKFLYTGNEKGVTVTAFSRDAATGKLTTLQTLSTVPEGTSREKLSVAEIAVHPSGRWLYVSNRGHHSIAVFEIADDGKLTSVQDAVTPVATPTSFAINPTGEWMVVGGHTDHRLMVFKIDAKTGKLSETGQFVDVLSPSCVYFPN